MNKQIERQIHQIYTSIFKKVFNRERLSALAKGSKVETILAIETLNQSDKFNDFCKKFSNELAKEGLKQQRGIWRKYFQAARQSGHIALQMTYNEFEFKTLSKATQQNFQMIKSMPSELLKVLNHKYTSTLIEEVVKGSISRGSFKSMLTAHGAKNAGVIARTETAKLQTVILQSRATDLGSVAYTWLASNDKRTRPSHKAMNGVVVFWNHEKPILDNMQGHAGEFPNCRCTPEPIMDENDLTKSNYKVYDYRINSIISLTKKQLIEALNKDSLS